MHDNDIDTQPAHDMFAFLFLCCCCRTNIISVCFVFEAVLGRIDFLLLLLPFPSPFRAPFQPFVGFSMIMICIIVSIAQLTHDTHTIPLLLLVLRTLRCVRVTLPLQTQSPTTTHTLTHASDSTFKKITEDGPLSAPASTMAAIEQIQHTYMMNERKNTQETLFVCYRCLQSHSLSVNLENMTPKMVRSKMFTNNFVPRQDVRNRHWAAYFVRDPMWKNCPTLLTLTYMSSSIWRVD